MGQNKIEPGEMVGEMMAQRTLFNLQQDYSTLNLLKIHCAFRFDFRPGTILCSVDHNAGEPGIAGNPCIGNFRRPVAAHTLFDGPEKRTTYGLVMLRLYTIMYMSARKQGNICFKFVDISKPCDEDVDHFK